MLSPSSIELLEQLKERIIAAFHAGKDRDKDSVGMWSDDASHLYAIMASAREAIFRNPPDLPMARGLLAVATSYCEQVASELSALGSAGTPLEKELRRLFRRSHDELSAQLPKPAARDSNGPPQRVVRISDERCILPCSVCGMPAVLVYPANQEEKVLQGLICAGITKRFELKPPDPEKILAWLHAGDFLAFHLFLEKNCAVAEDGLDAYCPGCDQIYCRIHYNASEVWESGFYDYSKGTCPKGHSRIIDD